MRCIIDSAPARSLSFSAMVTEIGCSDSAADRAPWSTAFEAWPACAPVAASMPSAATATQDFLRDIFMVRLLDLVCLFSPEIGQRKDLALPAAVLIDLSGGVMRHLPGADRSACHRHTLV